MNKAVTLMFAGTVLAAVAGVGHAQSFPTKPIRMIAGIGPGGAPDVLARTIAQRMSETIGQSVLVENRTGANGSIAAEYVLKSPPDGYTLFVADAGHYAINPALYSKLPYDAFRDFTPVSLAGAPPIYLVANANTTIRSVQDLINQSKQSPIPYGSSGNGNGNHLAMELFKSLTGANLTHIPYKGAATLTPAIVAGDVAVGFAGLSTIQPHVKSGRLRMLGVASGQRSSLTPDVPTVAEGGVPKFSIDISVGFLAPAATPRDVIMKLNTEINNALKVPEVRARLEAVGVRPVGTTPEQFGEAMRAEAAQLGALVRAVGAKVD